MSFQGIELPRDAEGREIPLSTKVLYFPDGKMAQVICFSYWPQEDEFRVSIGNLFGIYKTSVFLLYPSDSWEKLEHDATLAPRDYLQSRGLEEQKDGRIATMMADDLLSRAKALAEREKNAE